MRIQYKSVFLGLLFSMFLAAGAQPPMGGRNMQQMNMGHFYGKILDATTGKPIEAASVQLIQNKFDTVTKKKKDVVVAGMLTTRKGEFSLENLPVMASYRLKVTAIGYKTIEQKVNFEINMGAAKSGDYSSLLSGVDKDLGNIKLQTDAQQLEGVTVTATRPLLTMAIDRKIFNAEKNLTSAGGTAVDVMKNVPGVNVDIDGNVTLRNAAPQLFVDGRPTTMTLEQIPADAISTIEIITNPSAKFDASGGGAGILNIVLKKNRKAGYNGNVRSSIDSRARPSAGGDINIKQQKVNLFASGQVGLRKTISTVKTERTDFLSNGDKAHLVQDNGPVGRGIFGFGRLGMDYFIDNRNTITLSTNMSRGQFKNKDIINSDRDTNYLVTRSDYGQRTSNSTSIFRNYGASLSYKHNFTKANKDISADINYNYSRNKNVNDFGTQYFLPDNSPKSALLNEQSQGGGSTKFFTAQTDFTNPFTSKMKMEAGARIALRDFYSYNDNFYKNPSTGNFVTIPLLNNRYGFQDRVIAAYGTFSHQLKKFSYQLGLRVEGSRYDGNLISKNQQFSNSYPFSLFPSAFATYKLNDRQDLQINFSRKINRPNFFQLIPFIDYTDSLNLTKGNPALLPEFTHLVELSYQFQVNKNHSMLFTGYYKNTDDLITRFQYRDKNPDPSKVDSVVFTTYANASSTYTFGLEFTAKDKLASWWDLTTNFNLFNTTIKAGNLAGGINSDQLSWFAKISNNFKLPKNFSIQLSGNYQAKSLIPVSSGGGGGRGMGGGMMFGGGANLPSAQGYIKPLYEVEFAIKKEFLKNNAASLTLQMSDVFRTRLNSTHSESVYFVQDYDRRRDPQVLRLSFNWRFGKMDVSLFKRKNMKSEMDNMQNSMQGMGGQ